MTLTSVAVYVDITPDESYSLGGFAARSDRSSGRDGDLEANLVGLFSESSAFVWVGVDVLAITETMRDAIKDSVCSVLPVPPDAVLVVASHTHAAPAAWHGMIHPVLPADVDEDECRRIALLLQEAVRRSVPRQATVSSGVAHVEGVSANRHRPDGPVEQSLHALAVSVDGFPLAVVFDFACHPTVLGPENLLYSPDWVGGTRATVRQRLDSPSLPIVYLPGPGGDTSTRFHRRARTPEEADRLGAIVGTSVADSLEDAPTRHGAVDLSVTRKVFEAYTRRDFSDLGTQQFEGGSTRVKESLAEGAASRAAFEGAVLPRVYQVPVTTVRLGTSWWLHSPFEIAAALGQEICDGDENIRVIGYTDGYNGYLADEETFGMGGYEASASFFSQNETRRIIDVLKSAAASSHAATDDGSTPQESRS